MSQTHPPSEELFAYRDGELDPERRSLIEAHILSCTRCSAEVEALSDAEGALRAQTPEPDAAYFDRLTDAVLLKVGASAAPMAEAPAAGAPAPEGRGQERPAATPPAQRREAPKPRVRSGRRRNFEDEPRGRAPGLPWPAIISTVSAAAAVVVVAVLLFQRQDAWRHAPVPGVLGEPDAGRAPVTESKDNAAPPAEGEVPPSDQDEPPAAAGSGAAAPLAQGLDQGAAKLEPLAKEQDRAVGSAVGATVDERADRAAPRAEIRTESAEEALPDVAAQRQRSEKKASTDAPSSAASTIAPSPAGAENSYADIVARYGLPALYDAGRVRAAALLGAERDIRTLYQSGGAGADSARARLYLAEAARLRAGEDFDAETYDTIVHHYQRALRLAKDAETARVIRRRLEDFVSRSAPSR